MNFAEKNLALLSAKGLDRRIEEIQSMIEKYGKASHKEALESAFRIKEKSKSEISVKVFKADILSEVSSLKDIDIVMCDIPYGDVTEWVNSKSESNPVQLFLNNIKNILSEKSVVAISYNRKQEIIHEGYEKVGSIKVPKRRVIFLKPVFK